MNDHNTHPASGPKPYMTCKEVIDFLMAYIDNELPPEQRHEFDRHMGVCPSCVNYASSYQAAVRAGKAAMLCSEEPASKSVPPALIEAIRAARAKGK